MISKILPSNINTGVLIAGRQGVSGDQTGPLSNARFNDPQGLVMDKANAFMYIAQGSGKDVRRADLTSHSNGAGTGNVTVLASFNYAVVGIVIDNADSRLFVTCPAVHSIYMIVLKNNAVSLFAGFGNTSSKLKFYYLVIDLIFIDFRRSCATCSVRQFRWRPEQSASIPAVAVVH